MGLTHIITVAMKASQSSRKKYEADFLVDTGATDSMAPAQKLKRAGIRPIGKTTYELADGTTKEYEFGLVVVQFMGEITAGRVVFAPMMPNLFWELRCLSPWASLLIRQIKR